jgi:hypothetical protein
VALPSSRSCDRIMHVWGRGQSAWAVPRRHHRWTSPLSFPSLAGSHDGRFACTPASARQAPLPAPSAAPCCGPAGEFWPTCQEPHHGGVERILAPPEISALDQAEQWALATPGLSGIGREDDGAIFGTRERYNPPQVPTPMIGVPQLSANDVPDLPFPLQTDLFQLLWCPNDHDEPWWGHAR